jgi:hypothetical protein
LRPPGAADDASGAKSPGAEPKKFLRAFFQKAPLSGFFISHKQQSAKISKIPESNHNTNSKLVAPKRQNVPRGTF